MSPSDLHKSIMWFLQIAQLSTTISTHLQVCEYPILSCATLSIEWQANQAILPQAQRATAFHYRTDISIATRKKKRASCKQTFLTSKRGFSSFPFPLTSSTSVISEAAEEVGGSISIGVDMLCDYLDFFFFTMKERKREWSLQTRTTLYTFKHPQHRKWRQISYVHIRFPVKCEAFDAVMSWATVIATNDR